LIAEDENPCSDHAIPAFVKAVELIRYARNRVKLSEKLLSVSIINAFAQSYCTMPQRKHFGMPECVKPAFVPVGHINSTTPDPV